MFSNPLLPPYAVSKAEAKPRQYRQGILRETPSHIHLFCFKTMNEKFLNSFAKTELPKLGNVYLSAEKRKSQTSLWWEQKDSTFTHRTPMALFPLRWQYHKIWCKSNINSCLLDCSKDVKYLLKYYSECSWERTSRGFSLEPVDQEKPIVL